MVITNWVSLTNGPNGISGIPRPTLFGLDCSGAELLARPEIRAAYLEGGH